MLWQGGRRNKTDQLSSPKLVIRRYDVKLAMHRKCTAFQEMHPISGIFGSFLISASL